MYQPVLLYTTEEHGCSLTTFYVRVEMHEPTLLMIKTCNNEVNEKHLSISTQLSGYRTFDKNKNSQLGIRCVLLISLVWTKFKRWQRSTTSLFWHRWNVFVFLIPWTCKIPLGGYRRRQRIRTWFWVIHGSWFEDDNDWWRVIKNYFWNKKKETKNWLIQLICLSQ